MRASQGLAGAAADGVNDWSVDAASGGGEEGGVARVSGVGDVDDADAGAEGAAVVVAALLVVDDQEVVQQLGLV